MKMMDIKRADQAELTELYERYLNYGKGIRAYLDRLFHNEGLLGAKYVHEGKTVAAFACSEGVAFTIQKPALQKRIRGITGTETVYSIDMAFTREEYRNRGLQRKLSAKVAREICERGGGWILHEQWIVNGRETPGIMAPGCYRGSVALGNYPDFYRGIEKKGIFCPVCRGPCRCGAKIGLYKVDAAVFGNAAMAEKKYIG